MNFLLRFVIAALFAAGLSAPVHAQSSFTAKDGGGILRTFKSFNCSSVICSMAVPADVTGAAFGINGNPFFTAPATGQTWPISGNISCSNCSGSGVSATFGSAIGSFGAPGGFKDNLGNFQPLLGDVTNGEWVSIKASVAIPVTGTFWPYTLGQQIAGSSVPVVLPAAQITALTPPTSVGISGSLPGFASPPTVNLGTIGAAALESGGHLSSIDGKVPALGQALAAASVPVVLTAAQLATITPPTAITGFALDASVGTTNTDIGPPGATACATDTGSCSLNALTQRLAQRLTTINTTLGTPLQAGGSVSISNTPTVNLGTLNGAATAANQTAVAGSASGGTAASSSQLAGGVFNTVAPTLTNGQQAAFQVDSSGFLNVHIQAGGGAGGTSSTFGSAFPTLGTPGGFSQGGNFVAFSGTSGNLNVQCANCSGSGVSTADEATFTAGTSLFAGTGGFFQTTATNNPLTNGQQGMFQLTANRALFTNLRNAAGTEIGTSGAPLRVDPTGTTTQPVSGTITANAGTNLNTSLLALESGGNIAQLVTDFGAPGAAACTTDTASCSLNQQMQRLAQRLSTINTTLGTPFQAGGSIGNTSFAATQATAANLNAQVQGAAASGAAKSGNPVQIGGVFNTTQPTVTTGQAVEAQLTARGAQIVATGIDAFNVANGGTFAVQATLQASASTAIGKVDPNTLGSWGLQASTQNSATPTNGGLVLGQFNTTPTTITSGNVSPLQMDNAGNLLVNVKAGGAGGGAVFGPTAVGSAAANPPVLIAGTANATATGNVQVAKVSSGGALSTDLSTVAGAVPAATNPLWMAGAQAASTTMQNGATANGNGTSLTVTGYQTALVNVNCSVACSGGTTINFEGTDSTGTFFALAAFPVTGGSTAVSSATTSGQFWIPVSGLTTIRARISAYSAGTITVTGTPVFGVNASLAQVANTNANGQQTMANSSPVVIASNQSALTVNNPTAANLLASVSGASSNASSGVATSSTNVPAIAYLYGSNGTTYDQLQVDASKFLKVNVSAALPAGTNLMGKVGIDQTTPGTTNGVQDAATSATGSAPPAKAAYIGANASGATGGQLRGIINCDLSATYDASTTGSTQIVALAASQTIYVCGYAITVGGTATNVKLVYGTGSNCATGATNLTPAYQLVANGGIVDRSPFWSGMKTASANALCINASAANAVQATVYYAQF